MTRIFNHPELADTLVAGGVKTLAEQFSEDAVAETYMKLFAPHQGTSRTAA